MTIALSQFCIAFRRRSEAGRSGRHKCRENQYPHYNRSQPRHPDLPLWNAVPRRRFQRTARDASKHVRAIDAEILDQGPMHALAPTVTMVRATCRSRSEDRNQSQLSQEIAMLRKFALVIVAVASLSAVSLTPTPASAWHGGWRGGGWGWGGGWGPGWRGGWGPGWRAGWGPGWGGPGWGWRRGWGWGGPRFVVAPGFYGGGCVVRRLVPGPWGPRWVLVNRCW
jgi:hypothetical protein